MERGMKWPSCRLVVNKNSGRLKWCVGRESTWTLQLKYLVFLPVLLLPITLLTIHFLSRENHRSNSRNSTSVSENRLQLPGVQTNFVFDMDNSTASHINSKREVTSHDPFISQEIKLDDTQVRDAEVHSIGNNGEVNISLQRPPITKDKNNKLPSVKISTKKSKYLMKLLKYQSSFNTSGTSNNKTNTIGNENIKRSRMIRSLIGKDNKIHKAARTRTRNLCVLNGSKKTSVSVNNGRGLLSNDTFQTLSNSLVVGNRNANESATSQDIQGVSKFSVNNTESVILSMLFKRDRIDNFQQATEGVDKNHTNTSETPKDSFFKIKLKNAESAQTKTQKLMDKIKHTSAVRSAIFYENFRKNLFTKEEIRKLQANMMLQYMNLSIDPCQDFYTYACGRWEEHNPVPADKAGYDTFELLRESLDAVLRDLLLQDEPNEVENTSDEDCNFEEKSHSNWLEQNGSHNLNNCTTDIDDAIEKVKDLYRSCLDHETLFKRGTEPLLQLLKSLGGWPLLDPDWNETAFDWLDLISKLKVYNNEVLLSEWVGPDIMNSNEYIIQIDETTLGLPTRDYYILPANRKFLDAYTVYIMKVCALLGPNSDTLAQDVFDIVTFETELAKIMATPEERSNVTALYQRYTIDGLSKRFPQVNWRHYFSKIMAKAIDGSQSVVCFGVRYVEKLVKLLSETPNRTTSNYILWRFVRHRVNNLDDRFINIKQEFFEILFGREKSPPRWQSCIAQVNSNMGMAVGYLFVNKYFDESSRRDTLSMTVEIQQAFRDILEDTPWLDRDTRNLAINKINMMRLRVGYPDYMLNKKELSDFYKDITINRSMYFENTLSILRYLSLMEHSKLGQPVDKNFWNTPPAVVNAYYSRNRNLILFPAGILQPPFYHKYFPRSINYGGIGVVIGHEITHGFDDKGRLFDGDGNLKKWWKDESISSFQTQAQCLINQYGKYVISEIDEQVDGSTTQGENIADNGGLKQAFKAYTNWVVHNGVEDETFPELNVTNTQLFFLNFAQVWCGVMRPEASRSKLKTAVHSPGRYRVIGTLSNSEDFAREYGCPVGSPMNPHAKCSVW